MVLFCGFGRRFLVINAIYFRLWYCNCTIGGNRTGVQCTMESMALVRPRLDLTKRSSFDLIWSNKFDEIIFYWNIWSNQIAAQKYGLRSQRLGGREPAGKLNLIYCPHLLINPSWWVFSTIQLALFLSLKTYKKWLELWFIFFLLNLYTKIMIS